MVQEQIDIIKGNLDRLGKSVSNLGNRLGPVSRMEPTVGIQPNEKHDAEIPQVPSQLRDIAAQIDHIGLTVETLTRLLEI